MKTLETLYQEVLASDELKNAMAQATQSPEALEAWVKAQGCDATAEQIEAFLKEKESKTGELSDDELESAAGGCNGNEALVSVIGFGLGCAIMAGVSAKDDTFEKGKDGRLLCNG